MQRARPSSASLLFSCWCWRVGRAATVMPPPPTQDSQCRLASTAASFSSTGLSPHDLLSHVPQAVSPQSSADLAWVCSTTAALQLPAAGPSRGPLALSGVCMAVERIVCVILIQFRPSWIICFTFSLKCFPSDPNNCPTVGTGPLLQFPHPPRAGPVLLTLPFCPQLPSSYRVFHGSIYSFLLVRYSCPLSAGILQALLCLKVHSWCICGERCTTHPTTPPSCSPSREIF